MKLYFGKNAQMTSYNVANLLDALFNHLGITAGQISLEYSDAYLVCVLLTNIPKSKIKIVEAFIKGFYAGKDISILIKEV